MFMIHKVRKEIDILNNYDGNIIIGNAALVVCLNLVSPLFRTNRFNKT